MVTMMVLVGGIMALSLVVGCALGRAATQADMAREAAFARYLYEAELEHLPCQGLDDTVAVEAVASVLDRTPRFS
jgi:hypothetical protein